ncbi:MAG: tetratricopeptide repeat protein, partial [Glycomyces artemisiae]|nr:tetratricopeptide repeat protein [Glycomyces artemisiae]
LSALVNRAWTHRIHERYEESLADWNRIVELHPEHAADYTERGVVLQLMQRYEEAIADFDRALSLDPENGAATAQRGFTLHLQDRNEEALAELDRAVHIDPDAGWHYLLRAAVHEVLGHQDETLADYASAIDLLPEDATPYAYRGLVHREAGRLEEALADLDQAVALDPGYEWALERRNDTLFDLRRYDQLIPDTERLIGLGVDSEWVFERRVMGYLASGNTEAALAETTRMVAESPSDTSMRSLHAVALMSADRRDEARREVLASMDLRRSEPDPDPVESEFDLAVDLLLLGRAEEARELLDATLQSQPTADPVDDFLNDLAFLAACPGLEIEGLEEFRSIAAEYRDRLTEAE